MGKKIAIFDFTDCEGCEVELLGLGTFLMDLIADNELVNFRLGSDFKTEGPFDISIVEGVITNSQDIQRIKKIRQQSKILVALGSCATLGGIQSILNQQSSREEAKNKSYNQMYKLGAFEVKPIHCYVKVDYFIRGCPANPKQIKEALIYLLKDKIPPEKKTSVCTECPRGPFNSSRCLVRQKKKCLGVFTFAGCGAVCVESGRYCWGCWGLKQGITREMIKKTLSFLPEEELDKLINSFNAYI